MEFNNYIKLRNLILIGIEENNWTNQKILNQKSIDFFKYILPKTKEKAILNLAIQIACLDHDKNIQGNKYHLFSLPYNIERNLVINELVINHNNYLIELENLASGVAIDGKAGPVLVGSTNELSNKEMYRILAKHYLEAFKNKYKTYPYLN
jgi:hypothetical protein